MRFKLKTVAIVVALAFAASLSTVAFATKVDYIPSPGIKTWDPAASQYGKISYMQNGVKFRLVYNDSGATANAGEPAFYDWNDTNDYTVTTYESSAYAERFAGIWYCDDEGVTTIANGTYGWIQVAGIADAYVTGEGTSMVLGDTLKGYGSVKALTFGRKQIPTIFSSGSTWEVDTVSPRIMESMLSSATRALKAVLLRDAY